MFAMRKLILASALLSTLSLPALAEDPPCLPVDQLAAKLAAEFREISVGQGIGQDGKFMLVIFASPNGETWTAAMVRPDGLACFAAAGTDWQERHDVPAVPETGL